MRFRYGFNYKGFKFGWHEGELYRLPSIVNRKQFPFKKVPKINMYTFYYPIIGGCIGVFLSHFQSKCFRMDFSLTKIIIYCLRFVIGWIYEYKKKKKINQKNIPIIQMIGYIGNFIVFIY